MRLTLIAIIASSNLCWGQNLILNGSFENSSCPLSFNDFKVENWFSGNKGTPDLFHANCPDKFNVPNNWAGRQNAFEGKAYIGLYMGGLQGKTTGYYEYVGSELMQTLEKDKKYKLQFYFTAAPLSNYMVQQVNIVFESTNIKSTNDHQLIFKYNKKYVSTIELLTSGWKEATLEFTADGDEKFVFVGNFIPPAEAKLIQIKYGRSQKMLSGSAYYYFDNFSLVEIMPKLPVFSNILFAFDDIKITEDFSKELDNLSSYISDKETLFIELKGFSDTKGSAIYNLNLSKHRVLAVQSYLLSKGVDRKKIIVNYYGEAQAIFEKEKLNRRVEIHIKKGS